MSDQPPIPCIFCRTPAVGFLAVEKAVGFPVCQECGRALDGARHLLKRPWGLVAVELLPGELVDRWREMAAQQLAREAVKAAENIITGEGAE